MAGWRDHVKEELIPKYQHGDLDGAAKELVDDATKRSFFFSLVVPELAVLHRALGCGFLAMDVCECSCISKVV